MNAATSKESKRKAPAKPPQAAATPSEAETSKDVQPASDAALLAAKPAAEAPSTIKLSIPLDAPAAAVTKFIDGIKSRGAKLDVDLHSAACACLNHVALHNDPTLLNRLLVALPRAARRNAMIVWAMKYGNIGLNHDPKTKDTMPLVYTRHVRTNMDGAQAEPFFAMQAVREGGVAWLYMDYISTVLKTLERHVKADPTGAEGKRAKAALDALTGVNEALAIQPAAVVH